VLKSPTSWPKAFAFNTRRIIFPLLVLGKESTKVTSSGRAIGPTSEETCLRNSSANFGDASTPVFRITNEKMVPQIGCQTEELLRNEYDPEVAFKLIQNRIKIKHQTNI